MRAVAGRALGRVVRRGGWIFRHTLEAFPTPEPPVPPLRAEPGGATGVPSSEQGLSPAVPFEPPDRQGGLTP